MTPRWDFAELERVFKEFAGEADPSDPKERKRLKIVRAATELFIHHGYRKTSMDDVAREAGLAKGTLYLYCKTKGELLYQAITEEKRRYLSVLRPIFAEGVRPRERLRRWLRTTFTMAAEMPLLSRLMSGDRELLMALDEMPAELMQKGELVGMDFMLDLVAGAAPEGTDPGALRERAQVLIGLGYFASLIGDDHVCGDLSTERYAAVLADLIVDGIRRPAQAALRPNKEERDEKKTAKRDRGPRAGGAAARGGRGAGGGRRRQGTEP